MTLQQNATYSKSTLYPPFASSIGVINGHIPLAKCQFLNSNNPGSTLIFTEGSAPKPGKYSNIFIYTLTLIKKNSFSTHART